MNASVGFYITVTIVTSLYSRIFLLKFQMHNEPLLKSLLKFAEENFNDRYYACLDGEIKKIKLLALAIRRHRRTFARPFAKWEVIVLEELEKYIESKGVEEFREALEKVISTEEIALQEKKLPLRARYATS